jgi:hypothetical protein
MHNITFVNKANFVKLYNNFVLKWLIFALYVVIVPEQILESLSKTTKYEDEGILDNFCRLHIILRILSWTSLVIAQRVFPCVAVYEY